MPKVLTNIMDCSHIFESEYGVIDYKSWCEKELPRLNRRKKFKHVVQFSKDEKMCCLVRYKTGEQIDNDLLFKTKEGGNGKSNNEVSPVRGESVNLDGRDS